MDEGAAAKRGKLHIVYGPIQDGRHPRPLTLLAQYSTGDPWRDACPTDRRGAYDQKGQQQAPQ
jgi:hypothetical protein